MENKRKIIAILIAYNASKTLENFYKEFPKHLVDEIILVDDASKDGTYELAQKLGIISYQNPVNLGYGGNLKRATQLALDKGADIVIDIHPDGEYKPTAITPAINAIEAGADVVLGNRFTEGKTPASTGAFWWKVLPMKILNKIDGMVLRVKLDDYHQGFRAYTKEILNKSNFSANANDYLFSFDIIVQAIYHGGKIVQVPVETIYTGEKRGASFKNCVIYSLETFRTLFLFILAKLGIETAIFKKPNHA